MILTSCEQYGKLSKFCEVVSSAEMEGYVNVKLPFNLSGYRLYDVLDVSEAPFKTVSFDGIKYDCAIGHVIGRLRGCVPVLEIPTVGLRLHRPLRRPSLILCVELLLRVVGDACDAVTIDAILSGINRSRYAQSGQ